MLYAHAPRTRKQLTPEYRVLIASLQITNGQMRNMLSET